MEQGSAGESPMGTSVGTPSRRRFLAVSGAGVAAAGLVSVVPGTASAAEAPVDPKAVGDAPLLAVVDDLKKGRVTLVHGGTEQTVTDHDLARRIARLSTKGAKS